MACCVAKKRSKKDSYGIILEIKFLTNSIISNKFSIFCSDTTPVSAPVNRFQQSMTVYETHHKARLARALWFLSGAFCLWYSGLDSEA